MRNAESRTRFGVTDRGRKVSTRREGGLSVYYSLFLFVLATPDLSERLETSLGC
jgi:hypothetical protein